MTAIELLAPAKNIECALAAINHGADALYMGATRFGARASAGNSVQDIAKVCQYAHQWGVKVYVTINTLLYDEELEATEQLLWQLYEAGVDAFIVQDLALLKMNLPPVPLHASTQMHNTTTQQVKWLHDVGYEQAVLARECTLEEIQHIHNEVPTMKLEAFVHGALCVSYSGRCRASQYCFGRSANRGECAQFCRLPFNLQDATGRVYANNQHLLSLRDMNRTLFLEQMMDAGITSFKIEGRLKDVSYVKNITAWYRTKIDQIIARRPSYKRSSCGKSEFSFTPDPVRSFSRQFTPYFIQGKRETMASLLTPKSIGESVGIVKEVSRDSLLVAGTHSFANGDGLCYFNAQSELCGFRVNRTENNRIFPAERVNIPLRTELYRSFDQRWERTMARPTAVRRLGLEWEIKESPEGFRIIVTREDGASFCQCFTYTHERAKTEQTQAISELFSKLGNTIYYATQVKVEFTEPWFVPKSQWTMWRRSMLEELEKQPFTHDTHTPLPKIKKPVPQAFNISNRLAQQVCQESGVCSWEEALETQPKTDSRILMECKYCIRYELGLCHKQGTKGKELRLPLFLQSKDGKRFELKFDCRICQMQVLSTDK